MLAKVLSYGVNGLEAYPVTIEVDAARGLPSTAIVGLPDSAIKESKERVRSAIKNSGYLFEPMRLTINLSPADIKKEGPAFDLAIALGILAATEQINVSALEKFIFLGELSLDGRIQPIAGSLAIALASPKAIILPASNAPEAAVSNHKNLFPASNLCEVVRLLENSQDIKPFAMDIHSLFKNLNTHDIDFSEVKGQTHVKRGLEIAAAGGHNVLLIGPPGSGKSMLAKRLPTILPDMSLEEALETTKIYSVMGLLKDRPIIAHRPFRSPHHTISDVALVGGGSIPRAGEITLSHNGILFLDELPEFERNALEALRQPLEDQCVIISRASRSARFPAKLMLVCAMNPCPCGWLTDAKKRCHCSPQQIQRYLAKISGPLLDRMDIHLEVPSLPSADLLSAPLTETSQEIKKRTSRCRQIQLERFKSTAIAANAQMNHRQIKQHCGLSAECKDLLKQAIEELNLSARAYDRILKVARTIADLDEKIAILPEHLAEAIQYRNLDRAWRG